MSISRTLTSITAEAALQAVVAAQDAAKARNVAVVATVVDPGGHVVASLRGDGAFVASINIAHDKAWTAAIFGASTDQLHDALSARQVVVDGIAARPNVVLFGGGFPLKQDGVVIGGIGVSGGSEDDDRVAATAALAALGLTP
jgi:uncharacterized protein GlcG (DUF336 family)